MTSTIGPPVSSLSNDVLSLIFEMNAIRTDGADQPLSHTIRASQVCQAWRQTILNSPLLWGRLVDFDHYATAKEAGRTAVLRRSASAPLWITGHLRTEGAFTGLFSVLEHHWDRVQILDIHLWGTYLRSYDELWAPLFRPAPVLQVFKLPLVDYQPSPTQYTPALFRDHAPQLTIFHFSGIPFGSQAPWLGHVRDIKLSNHRLTISDILNTLRNATSIESITIDNVKVAEESPSDSPTQIPIEHARLRELHILHCPIEVWLPITKALVPRPIEFFTFNVVNSGNADLGTQASQEACQHVFKFIQSFQAKGQPKHILRIILNSHNRVTQFGLSLESVCGGRRYLVVDLIGFSELSRLLMTNMASLPLLSDVKEMRLYFTSDVRGLFLPFAHLMSALVSLESITLPESALEFIVEFCDPLCMPALHTIKLHQLIPRQSWPMRWSQLYPRGVVFAFLQRRKSAGISISFLDLKEAPENHGMDFLLEMPDLTVFR